MYIAAFSRSSSAVDGFDHRVLAIHRLPQLPSAIKPRSKSCFFLLFPRFFVLNLWLQVCLHLLLGVHRARYVGETLFFAVSLIFAFSWSANLVVSCCRSSLCCWSSDPSISGTSSFLAQFNSGSILTSFLIIA